MDVKGVVGGGNDATARLYSLDIKYEQFFSLSTSPMVSMWLTCDTPGHILSVPFLCANANGHLFPMHRIRY